MAKTTDPYSQLTKDELILRLEEAEETLRAIRSGEVDALVVSGTQGEQIFTLKDATLPYQILIEEMNEGALTLTPEGMILYCNACFVEFLGLARETILGESFFRYVAPGAQARAKELLGQRPKGKSRGELTLLGRGAEIQVGISLTEIRLDGELRLGVVVSDLTERTQAEAELRQYREQLEEHVNERTQKLMAANEALRASRRAAINLMQDALSAQEQVKQANASLSESEQRFRLVLQNAPIVVAHLDRQLCYTWIYNPKGGFTPEEIIGKPVGLSTDPETARSIQNSLQQVLDEGIPAHWETNATWAKTGALHFESHAEPLRNSAGEITGVALVSIDITERKRAEAELIRLASFPERNPNPIVELEYLGEIVYLNPKARELFPDIAAGHPILEGLGEFIQKFIAGYETYLSRDINTGEVYYHQTIVNVPESRRIRLYHIDITKRKQAEEALRRNEALLLETGRMAKIGGWELDLQTMQPTWTLETYHIHEVDVSLQPKLEDAINFYAPEARPQIDAAVRRAIDEGQAYDLELPFITAKGRNIWIRTMGQPEFRDGRCVRLYGTFQDITERRQAEEQLERSNQKLNEILASIQDDFYVLDHNWMFVYANRLFTSKVGKEPEDFIGRNIWEMFPKHVGTVLDENFRATMEKRQIRRFEVGGKYTAAWYRMTVFPSADGITVLGTDITEIKRAEEALIEASLLKQASQYARTLIEVSLDPLVTISSEGKITDVNAATIQATGVSREELIDTNFSDYFTEPEKAEQGYKQVFVQGYATDYPLTIRHRDGRLMDVLYNASLYQDAAGKVLGVFAAARDVTSLKQAEAELKRHKENLEMLVKERTAELEESNRDLARSNENLEQFAYVASHDLQEPLRIMSSYSQLLERRYRGRLDQDADEFINFIVDAAARMQKLITDLLAYSRAGRETTDLVEVDCNKLLRKLVAGMAVTLESADACVTFDRLPSIMAHETSLIQLFQNLIGNALKFHGELPPNIHVSARQAGAEWVFSVRDNGIGIEPQYCERIFMIFQRLHPRDKYPGTGIGLSICKKIVENQGGRIWVESEPGQGSTFIFTVPIRKV